jgi:hypothetical protein
MRQALIVLLGLSLLACGAAGTASQVITPMPIPAATQTVMANLPFATVLGNYDCFGTSWGMRAGSGTLVIYGDGSFFYIDLSSRTDVTGTLEWGSDTELEVVEDIDILSITILDEDALSVTVTEGAFTHSNQGRLTCTEF